MDALMLGLRENMQSYSGLTYRFKRNKKANQQFIRFLFWIISFLSTLCRVGLFKPEMTIMNSN